MKFRSALILSMFLALAVFAQNEDFTEIQAERGTRLAKVVAKLHVDPRYVVDIAKLNNIPADAPFPETMTVRVPWRYMNTDQAALSKKHAAKKPGAQKKATTLKEDGSAVIPQESKSAPVITNGDAIQAEVDKRMQAERENWQAERQSLQKDVDRANARLRQALQELAVLHEAKPAAAKAETPAPQSFWERLADWGMDHLTAIAWTAGICLLIALCLWLLRRSARKKRKPLTMTSSVHRPRDTSASDATEA